MLGIGDGSNTTFPLRRGFGDYGEAAQGTSGVTAVYQNGLPVGGAAWSVSPGYLPAVVFAAPPEVGVAVSADFDLLWLCRFSDDVADFEEFMAMLWTFRTVKMRTARP